mmetsp:Transcript_20777/g.43522  ORF Transcript_20777/g.43522 Transcript_20777/m.43522 type:complete len:81 (+) Transcript_20777:2124-2366(+)
MEGGILMLAVAVWTDTADLRCFVLGLYWSCWKESVAEHIDNNKRRQNSRERRSCRNRGNVDAIVIVSLILLIYSYSSYCL